MSGVNTCSSAQSVLKVSHKGETVIVLFGPTKCTMWNNGLSYTSNENIRNKLTVNIV
jgi:hypothetical protein